MFGDVKLNLHAYDFLVMLYFTAKHLGNVFLCLKEKIKNILCWFGATISYGTHAGKRKGYQIWKTCIFIASLLLFENFVQGALIMSTPHSLYSNSFPVPTTTILSQHHGSLVVCPLDTASICMGVGLWDRAQEATQGPHSWRKWLSQSPTSTSSSARLCGQLLLPSFLTWACVGYLHTVTTDVSSYQQLSCLCPEHRFIFLIYLFDS